MILVLSAIRSSLGLMLVEDPRDTIRVLCDLPQIITWHSYKEKYERMKGLFKPISTQHADTHFYSLSIYGIIEPLESSAKGQYKLSVAGKALCESLVNDRIADYQRILANVLINNSKKGHIFRQFLDFIQTKNSVSFEEVSTFVQNLLKKRLDSPTVSIVARTLMAWSEDAGLIEKDTERKIVWLIKQKPKITLSLEQFWVLLNNHYKNLRQSEIFGIEHIYVDILELRTIICLELSWPNEEFDSYLSGLLDSEIGNNIKLYGAPTSFFSNRENFTYKGRIYAYIAIRCA